jgi:hypothetical protein
MKRKMNLWGLLLWIGTALSAQNPKLMIGMDRVKLALWEQERATDLKLTPFLLFEGDSAFRFFTGFQFVELLYENGKRMGRIISFGTQYKSQTSGDQQIKTKKVYLKEFYLVPSQFLKLDSLIRESKIGTIPTDDSIPNWKFGFDGTVYEMESTNPKKYGFQSYWSPEAQNSTLLEAKQVEYFVLQMHTILNLETEWSQFIDGLPSGVYTFGTRSVVTIHRTFKHRLGRFWRRMFH